MEEEKEATAPRGRSARTPRAPRATSAKSARARKGAKPATSPEWLAVPGEVEEEEEVLPSSGNSAKGERTKSRVKAVRFDESTLNVPTNEDDDDTVSNPP